MESPLVSIIVPVYNAEASLRACVESISAQSYRNLEVLLVNDGSTDGSLALCRAFEVFDRRVKVIDKPNSGVSASRNAGIECARGKYLQFVDGDDRVTPDSTEKLVRRAEETGCDLVIADFYRVVDRRVAVKGNIDTERVLTKKEFAEYLMENPANFYYGVMWNKLYRRDIVCAHDIRCCTQLLWCEDFLFNMDYINFSERFSALRSPVYYYIKRRGSLATAYLTPKAALQMKRTLYEPYKEIFESVELYERNRARIRRFFVEYARDGTVTPLDTLLTSLTQDLPADAIPAAPRKSRHIRSVWSAMPGGPEGEET